MGDGGVACVASQHVMEKFTICGSKTNGKSKPNSSSKSSVKLAKVKQKMKPKKDRGGELSVKNTGSSSKESTEKNGIGEATDDINKEEVEEGELGTLPIENGEFFRENTGRRYDIKSEIEKGEFVPGRWRKNDGELERDDWRSSKDELEKGEFVADRWCRGDGGNRGDDYGYSKARRYDIPKEKGWKFDREWVSPSAKERGWKFDRDDEWNPSVREKSWKTDREWSPPSREKGWKGDREREWTPPSSCKYSSEKEFSRSGGSSGQHSRKFSSKMETEKTPKVGSKIVGEEVSLKNEHFHGKNHAKNYSLRSRSKRYGMDSDMNDRKHRVDYDDYPSSKSRKLSDDGIRSTVLGDHYSGRFVDKPYKNSTPSRNIPSERFSSRHLESSRTVKDWQNGSPHHSERSPHDWAHNHDHRGRSPVRRGRSPYERNHQCARSRSPHDQGSHNDGRYQSPSCVDRSPHDQDHTRDGRDLTPTLSDRSPFGRGRGNQREANRKLGVNEKRSSHHGNKGKDAGKGQEPKKDSNKTKSQKVSKESFDKGKASGENGIIDKIDGQPRLSQSPTLTIIELSQENRVMEEPASMEEDMDICNTPPHAPVVANAVAGNWYYLDLFGVEHGPLKLSDLKALVEEGYLVSDHFIKHLDSDRWTRIENASSPLVTKNLSSVIPDTVTQLVNPPEAPGNLLTDNRNLVSEYLVDEEDISASQQYLYIDERVGALLEGVTLIPGKELETVEEVLLMKDEHNEWMKWRKMEGFNGHQLHMGETCEDGGFNDFSSASEIAPKDTAESEPTMLAFSDKDITPASVGSSEWLSGQWSCKGGDWKRNDEAIQDRIWKRKLILNDGYPLCQMSKSCCEDPRWLQKDELYCPSLSTMLDLPPWAFTSPDDLNDPSNLSRLGQTKSPVVKGVKGTILPVIRINACVVKDHGSFVPEPRVKIRGNERFSSRTLRPYSTTSDTKRSSEDGHSRNTCEQDSRKSCATFVIPKDRLHKVDELQLHLGDWYYLDGAGHEQGPLPFLQLQVLADQGVIQKHSSVFRKLDKIWVPVTFFPEASDSSGITEHAPPTTGAVGDVPCKYQRGSSGFHDLHPQFIGYTRGKLQELVMKSYRSREFTAAINEVLDPWISARQPKKETEKQIHHSDHVRASKRARIDGIEEKYEMEEDVLAFRKDSCVFDDLCAGATCMKGDDAQSVIDGQSWALLDGHVLARVFHFLRSDIKSLIYVSLTCKHWRSVVKFYKDISKQVDFWAIASICTDSMVLNIMNNYKKERITSLLLRGCTGISSGMLEELLRSFPSVSAIDIRGCTQFEDLVCKFPTINWVKNQGHLLKTRSLSQLTDKGSSTSYQTDDSSGLKEYLESSDKRDSAHQLFRHNLYKRSKLFDARKSLSILSRDAQLRRLAMKKAGDGYKRMKEFIATSLRDIMKDNTFEFFDSKVAEIEEKMKNGYYATRGLNSIKDDISRMCRDAIKNKNHVHTRDVNRVVTLFIQLVTTLEKGSKSAYDREQIMKSWKDDSHTGFSSASSKYKKNLNKPSERKYLNKSNGNAFVNGVSDFGEYASDRELRKRLSKLNKKSLDSGSETSDDSDKSSGFMTDSESTASDTESDLEFQSEGAIGESRGEANANADDGLDSWAEDREWGARMTKASLVPPVTRKYEVIDHYVIVADEEEVRRKMQVSLPEDYADKLNAQRNGTEDSDMEIPEVKDYKPRKSLGDEVIEQEVYGIDPYTHNLLLDSMPDESDWSLLDKHLFIEDVLLVILNKQVRNFTGSGNTPMVYSLKPVFEEILETAEENYDRRTMRLCQLILKAIDSRPEDNYVAYRKGLGVVCNKEGGFGEDDFVVEFLGEVYPTWKWYEKQDGIRSLQKNNKDPAPEFYNIYLERPKGDADGYDLVVVDAMHKANYASRICHSCKPNCQAKVTAVDGQYQIGIYSVRPIAYGEEITFDYNSVTESKEEYEVSVCLCGNQVCRGSYLNLTGEGAFQKVLKEYHGLLDRHRLMLEACELNSVSEEDYIDLGKAGLGSCLLGGLPDWLIAYSARLVRFINFERTKLPHEILRHNIEEKKKYFADIRMEVEKSDAEIQAEGVYNQRLQNLALTIDKVRYVMRCVFGDPKKAPPPLERLSPESAVSYIWKGEGSFVEELIQGMAPHLDDVLLRDMKAKIRAHDPSGSNDIRMELRESLLWLRDEVRNLPCTYKSRHDAAADLIHLYAHTQSLFKVKEYNTVTSPPVHITPLDLGPKYADKLGSDIHEYCKTYSETYCLGQLLFWYNQDAEPDALLAKSSRGCLSLPDVGSFYAKVQKPSRQRVYGPRTLKFMLARMEKQPQRPWPKDRIWSFNTSIKVFGSPMLDAALHDASLDKEMVYWLKHRPSIFQAMWDR